MLTVTVIIIISVFVCPTKRSASNSNPIKQRKIKEKNTKNNKCPKV